MAHDPTIDGVIMTTPQSGAYDDLVKKLEAKGIPVATTNSFDPKHRSTAPAFHTPARIASAARSAARRSPSA